MCSSKQNIRENQRGATFYIHSWERNFLTETSAGFKFFLNRICVYGDSCGPRVKIILFFFEMYYFKICNIKL